MITILGALNHNGMLAAMTIEAATDREIFLAFLDDLLCPKLQPGDVLVMDNLSAHKVDGVRQRVEATGARLLYLPTYSPDLNPIEKAWASLRHSSVTFRPAPQKRSTTPSPTSCQQSSPKMQRHGSGYRSPA